MIFVFETRKSDRMILIKKTERDILLQIYNIQVYLQLSQSTLPVDIVH